MELEKLNNELRKVFRTQEFKSFLVSHLHHVPGSPYLVIRDKDERYPDIYPEPTLECAYEALSCSDYWDDRTPEDEVKFMCLEYVEETNQDLYEQIRNILEEPVEVLASDYVKATKERFKNDLELLKYLEIIYGGQHTIDELIEKLTKSTDNKENDQSRPR